MAADLTRLVVYLTKDQAEAVRELAYCRRVTVSRWIKDAIRMESARENEIWEQVNADVHATADRMIADHDDE